MPKLRTIVMACDRTGGHVYPAQVLAEHIRDSKEFFRIIFYGVRNDDAQRLRQMGYDVFTTSLTKRRHLILELIISLYESVKLLIKCKPACIVGFGGRASFFLVILGRIFSKTVLYEPNAVYGRANKVLSFFSAKIFLGLKDESKSKEHKVGVPVRYDFDKSSDELLSLKKELGLDPDKKIVLIFGGSSGSRAINASVRAMFEKDLFKDGWQLIHITGSSEYGMHKDFYSSYESLNIICKGYTNELDKYYLVSDVIVARSGASSVAELELLHKPIVFIPYPYAYSHQFHNARLLADTRGIQIIDQKFLDENMLWDTIIDVDKYQGLLNKTKFAWVKAENFASILYAEIKKMVGHSD